MSMYPKSGETLPAFIVRYLLDCNRLRPENPQSIMSHADVVGDCLGAWRCIHEDRWHPGSASPEHR